MHPRLTPCIPLVLVTFAGLSGCDDDYETTGFIRVIAESGAERAYVVPDAENVGAGPARLGPVAGNVEQVRYAIGEERSAYLLDGSLAAGIEVGGILQLPAYGDGDIVEEDGVAWQVVETDRPDYESFRVYDSGSCSLTLDWETALLPGLVPAFAPTVAAAVDRELARCSSPSTQRFSRVGAALVEPVYRAVAGGGAGALGTDDDVMRYSARYNAPSIGGCAPVNLDLGFEFGFREGPEGEIVGFVDPQTVFAEVADFCIVEDMIENSVQEKLLEAIGPALQNALTTRTRIDPTLIGLPPAPGCSEDSDCSGAFPGTGHTCTMGTCQLQLNVDRVNVRPEGVELIITETDADPQRMLLDSSTPTGTVIETFACGPDRGNGMLTPAGPTASTLSSTSVPVGANATAICGGP